MPPKEAKTPHFTEATWDILRKNPAFAAEFFDAYLKESIPIQVALLRGLAGMSQMELSKKLGVKQTHHSRLEKHNSDHLISAYEKVAKQLNAKLALIPNEARIVFNRNWKLIKIKGKPLSQTVIDLRQEEQY